MRTFRSAIILLVVCGLPQSLRSEVPGYEIDSQNESMVDPHSQMPSPVECEESPGAISGVDVSPHSGMVREATRRRVRTVYRGPAQLTVAVPGVFVHQPQQVRVSERTAELWIKLPENAYVSVNFVEYSPVGGFRIFKTKLSSHEPRRYYIDAWCPCPGSCGRESLGAPKDSPHVNVDENGMQYVDLLPGDRVVVDFSGKAPCPEIFPNITGPVADSAAASSTTPARAAASTAHEDTPPLPAAPAENSETPKEMPPSP